MKAVLCFNLGVHWFLVPMCPRFSLALGTGTNTAPTYAGDLCYSLLYRFAAALCTRLQCFHTLGSITQASCGSPPEMA